MSKRLTFSKVKEQLSKIDLTIHRTGFGKEVKVRLKHSPRGEGYFTEDLQDALSTGREMRRLVLGRMLKLIAKYKEDMILQAEAEQMDAAFDAGEFSGPEHCQMQSKLTQDFISAAKKLRPDLNEEQFIREVASYIGWRIFRRHYFAVMPEFMCSLEALHEADWREYKAQNTTFSGSGSGTNITTFAATRQLN